MMNPSFKTPEGQSAFTTVYERALERWPVPVERLFVPTRFGRTHVLVSGPREAPPFFLLHGMTGTSTMWAPNIAALARTHRVYMPEVPGDFGWSEVERPLGSRDDCAAWLGEVMDGLKVESAMVGGQSLGGWLSLNFALKVPARVNALVLIAPAGCFAEVGLQFILHAIPCMFFPYRPVFDWSERWMCAPGNTPPRESSAVFAAGMKHFRSRLQARPGPFPEEELRRLLAPTLLLVGDKEVITSGPALVARARQLVPHVQAELVPNAGHLLSGEQPEHVNARVVRFLEDLARPSQAA
ncbi:alpha/beta fold hydrolase [Archangium lipolyticum]|uniref:alpha/beta fold hydrolase n=1 Tax=Archangium lipolyticum TaxID=2970465 RepID=UPI002149FC74|nr:alpha/beta hydrolase [Archangium lipolyticum]